MKQTRAFGTGFLSAFTAILFSTAVYAGPADPGAKIQDPSKYRRKEIAHSRFGEGKRKELLNQAYRLKEEIDKRVVGQDRVARVLQARLIQYLEGFGSRTKDPVAMHLIGLPGVGKSSILDVLQALGFTVFRVDAQKFTREGSSGTSVSNLFHYLKEFAKKNEPAIILFDELDKVAEMTTVNGAAQEVTQPLIGMLNEILTGGKVSMLDEREADLSNCMILTAMNLAPGEIERFTQSTLGVQKSFYEFTVDDFSKFDTWVRSGPHATSMLLSRLFRSNTVSRLVPNALIVKSLTMDDYRKVAKITADAAILANTTGKSAGKRVEFDYDDAFLDFLHKHSVYAPSGARDTVLKVNALTEQLINFGGKTRGSSGSGKSLSRPRKIHATYDANLDRVLLTITPRHKAQRSDAMIDDPSFQIQVEYDADSRSFFQPDSVMNIDPPLPKSRAKSPSQKPITKKQIREMRYPPRSDVVDGLAERLDAAIRGQQRATRAIENNLGIYMGRPGPVEKAPQFLIFSGFPGIGKSELVVLTARELKLPIVRINMQEYSSDADTVVLKILDDLDRQIKQAGKKRPDGRFILQLEELDKCFEIGPDGSLKNRPAMRVIKDLLNDGIVVREFQNQYGGSFTVQADIRAAFTFVTMNFAVDRFGFKADPRLTTIDDVIQAWKRLSSTPADLKKVMGSMFLPETVNRLLPYLMVLKPLKKPDYEWIIQNQSAVTIDERLLEPKTKRNLGMIDITLSDEYRKYLYSECVIPSEGGRFAAVSSKKRIAEDMEAALKKLATVKKFGTNPLEIQLDFDQAKSEVRVFVLDKGNVQAGAKPVPLMNRAVVLSFPPININGAVPEERLVTSVHEFGHAFAAIRLGMRFEYTTVAPPETGIGGYVKQRSATMTAQSLVSQIYTALGSRAMERIFLSKDPTSRGSFLDIQYGASMDISGATKILWHLIYEFGFDPNTGVIERKGVDASGPYAAFSALPAEKVEALGRILAGMEDHLVEDFMAAHPGGWYREHILALARKGGMTEEEFYREINYFFPGEGKHNLAQRSEVLNTFGEDAVQPPKEVLEAMKFEQGETRTTARQNLDVAMERFKSVLKKELHALESGDACEGVFEK